MRTARARPSPGTCCEVLKPKVPVRRMVFHEITRDAIQAAVEQHPRPRPAPRRRAGDPPHPRPALRLRGQPGAVAEGPPGPVRRPRAVRRDPARRRARARADGVPRRVVLGRRRRRRSRGRPRSSFDRPPGRRRRRAGRHRPRLRRDLAELKSRRRRAPRRGDGRGARRRRSTAAPFAVRSVEEKPYTPLARPRRS